MNYKTTIKIYILLKTDKPFQGFGIELFVVYFFSILYIVNGTLKNKNKNFWRKKT